MAGCAIWSIGAFRLVREALAEREVLLRIAPHLIRPMRFVLPAYPGPRSALLLRLGLFLYDHLGGAKILPATRTLDLTHHAVGPSAQAPLSARLRIFRLLAWTMRAWWCSTRSMPPSAAPPSARVRGCARAERGDIWRLILNDRGRREVVTRARAGQRRRPLGRLRRRDRAADAGARPAAPGQGQPYRRAAACFRHDRGYILQISDRRVVFVLPFERDFTLIGTTDADFAGDPAAVAPTGEEITYLCDSVNDYFRHGIERRDVKWAFAGVRSLYDDGSKKPEDVTRDYHLTLDERFREAPLLTVYGGKITTYRRLAEAVMERLRHFFHMRPAWTAQTPLPGGDFAWDGADGQVAKARQTWPFLEEDACAPAGAGLWHAHRPRARRGQGAEDLGTRFGADLTEAEVRYLMQHEWAESADDVLWRRSKLGLLFSDEQKEALGRFMARRPQHRPRQ